MRLREVIAFTRCKKDDTHFEAMTIMDTHKTMQNYLFYHLVMRATIHCPIGVMTSVLSEILSATTDEMSGLWLFAVPKNTLIMGELKPDGNRLEQAQQEIRTRNHGFTMYKRR
jgi:hypothetical protein